MSRYARVVIPGLAHHVTQRGNRRQRTFYCDDDYRLYLALMREWCDLCGVDIWAWCLMPNHAHFIAVPSSADGLRRAVGQAHRRYTTTINKREGWKGYLWQGRFASFAMDESHTLAAARYIELNPVRAGLVARPEEYPWSSARHRLRGAPDPLLVASPVLDRVADWGRFLTGAPQAAPDEALRQHGSTGRPLGNEEFIAALENQTGRALRQVKRGRPRKDGSLEKSVCPGF